jgi:hypothetical protein
MVNPIESILIKAFEGTASMMRGCEKHTLREDELHIGEAAHLYRPKHKEHLYLSVAERQHHSYVLGASGSGKSKLLEFLIRQDIQAGRGFCLIDPHGDLYQNILNYLSVNSLKRTGSKITNQIRNKLVLFDPTVTKWIIGFNPLEAANVNPYALAMEFNGFLKKIFLDLGARTGELMLNTTFTLSHNKLTLLEAKALLTDLLFRNQLVDNLPEGEIKEYWLLRYNLLSDRMQATYREPILNRLSIFLSDPSIRLIVGQKKSTIDFRKIMDQSNWLMVNLSKGRLKSNAHLLGAFLIAKLQLCALSRVDVTKNKRTPFYIYVDEFQNFVSEDFETILSEARKYGLGLTLAHQNMDQLDRQLRSAILGNTLIQVFFRISNQDATALAAEIGQREKAIIQKKLVNLKQREAYFKKKGEPARLMKTIYVPPVNASHKDIEALIELSMSCHARSRREVELEIENRKSHSINNSCKVEIQSLNSDPDAGKFAPEGNIEEFKEW